MEKINFTVKDVKGANFGINDVAVKKVYPPLVDETVIPTKEQQVLTHEGEYGYDTVTVEPIPDEYIIPEGTLPITENTIYDVTKFKRVSANVKPAPELQNKETTPTKETQNVTFDSGFDGLHTVTIKPIPNNYIEPTGTKEIKTEGTHDVTEYASVDVDVEPTLQDKQVTITENGTQNITADEGFDGLGNVEITTNAIENLTEELTTYNSGIDTQEITIDDIVTALSNKGAGKPKLYTPKWVSFSGCSKDNLDYEVANLDVINMTSLYGMFANCHYVVNVDIRHFNTDNITSTSNMFYYSKSFKNLDLSNFNGANVTNTSLMFRDCTALEEVNLHNFNTPKLTNIAEMFRNCPKLKKIDLSNFDTSNVTNGTYVFYNCSSLITLILGGPVVFKVTNANAFSSSGIASGICTVYVPDDLILAYQENTYWAPYANQIKGISELPIEEV